MKSNFLASFSVSLTDCALLSFCAKSSLSLLDKLSIASTTLSRVIGSSSEIPFSRVFEPITSWLVA
jgi:hypothetical protein